MKTKSIRIAVTVTCWFAFGCLSARAQMTLPPEPFSVGNLYELTSARSSSYRTATENKFYVKAYGFYALLTPGAFRGIPPSPPAQNGSGNVVVTNSGYTSSEAFGGGLRIGAGVGMVVNDFINVGIDGEYLLGNAVTESYQVASVYNGTSTIFTKVSSSYPYRIVNLIPNITFKAVSKAEYYIYNRIGVVVGIPTQLDYVSSSYNTYSYRNASDFYEYLTEYEFEKKIGFGYQAALGIQFRLSGSLRGFVEVVASNLQLKSTSYVVKDASVRYRIDTESENTEPRTKGQTVSGLDIKMPVSSVGIGAGLVFRF
jgi:hypothetical protein